MPKNRCNWLLCGPLFSWFWIILAVWFILDVCFVSSSWLVIHSDSQDGAFWMENCDYVALARGLTMNRAFGPTWQCAVQYGTFGKPPPYYCVCKRPYRGSKRELSMERGDKIEILDYIKQGHFPLREGKHVKSGRVGKLRTYYVSFGLKDTFKYELTLSNVSPNAQVIVVLAMQNVKKMRLVERHVMKDQEMTYETRRTKGPYSTFEVHDSRGQKHSFDKGGQNGFGVLNASNGPFKVYVSCEDMLELRRFALYALAPHGELQWKQLECDRDQWISEVGASNVFQLGFWELLSLKESWYPPLTIALDKKKHGKSL